MNKKTFFLIPFFIIFIIFSCKREKKELGPTTITVDTVCNILYCELKNPVVKFEVKGQIFDDFIDGVTRITHLHGFMEGEIDNISFSTSKLSMEKPERETIKLTIGYVDASYSLVTDETGKTVITFEDWSISFEGSAHPSDETKHYHHVERLRFAPEEIIRSGCLGGECPIPGITGEKN
jgi:hypothetical protein